MHHRPMSLVMHLVHLALMAFLLVFQCTVQNSDFQETLEKQIYTNYYVNIYTKLV